MALLLIADAPPRAFVQLWKQIKSYVRGLKVAGIGIANVVHQRSKRARARRRRGTEALTQPRNMDSRKQSHGDGFGVALNTGNLSGKKDIGMLLQIERLGQQRRRVDVGVAMNLSIAQEARIFQAGNKAQHARLLTKLQ